MDDWFWSGVFFAGGFATAVAAGARGGHSADDDARVVEICQDAARWDAAACERRTMQRFDLVAAALSELGDRCVLTVPPGDRLRVVRVPPVVMGPALPDDPEN